MSNPIDTTHSSGATDLAATLDHEQPGRAGHHIHILNVLPRLK
jgi:hypothetical protein